MAMISVKDTQVSVIKVNDEDYIIKNIEKELKATDNPQDWYYVLKAEKK